MHNAFPGAAGVQQNHTRTPASMGRTLETALMRIGSMDPGSGAFGAALAAAERISITPKHRISRSISQVCLPVMPIICSGRGGGARGRGGHDHVMQAINCTFSCHGGHGLCVLCSCCKAIASICICTI